MTDLNKAFKRFTKINTYHEEPCIKYDYKICPICNSNNTYAVTNDGGSIGGCLKCNKTFKSKKINSVCKVLNKY